MGILIKGMDEIPEDGAVLVVKHDNGKAYIKHACTYGYSMELVKLPAVQPDHNADSGKKVCVDTISRQAALKKLAVYIHLIDKTMGKGLLTDDDCMEAAKSVLGEDELPAIQPETNWIPCSERMPERADNVIICYKAGDYTLVSTGRYLYKFKMWYVDVVGDLRDGVTAWMPLPEPYQGGETE